MPNCRMAKKSAVTPSNSAMRHNPAYGIMTELMQRGAVPVDRLEIGLRGWDLHIVFSRRIEGTIAANAKRDASGPDQGFDRGLDQTWREARRWRCPRPDHRIGQC